MISLGQRNVLFQMYSPRSDLKCTNMVKMYQSKQKCGVENVLMTRHFLYRVKNCVPCNGRHKRCNSTLFDNMVLMTLLVLFLFTLLNPVYISYSMVLSF